MEPGRQFQQLSMFATPAELAPHLAYGDQKFHHSGGRYATLEEKKLDQSRNAAEYRQPDGSSLYGSVAREGIKSPLLINHNMPERMDAPTLSDGHHRFFSALSSRPHDLVPLVHADWKLPGRLEALSSQPRRHDDGVALGG